MSLVCSVEGRCLAPSCGNGTVDGTETDVDCGGACDPCAPGSACEQEIDCASQVCDDGRCSPPTCANGMQDEGETDLDCGGPCAGCGAGEACLGAADCQSGACRGSGICRDPCFATIGVECDGAGPVRLSADMGPALGFQGGAVAVEGDLLAIGAPASLPGADSSIEVSGSVHVYRRVAEVWEYEATLEAITPAHGDGFGASLSLHEGVLLVGEAGGRGAVHEFQRLAGEWTRTTTILPPAGAPEIRFGFAMDREGDRLVVGAPDYRALDEAPAGRVDFYERVAGVWTHRHSLRPGEPANRMGYGESVAISGELIVVGAPGQSGSDFHIDGSQIPEGSDTSGAVFVYRGGGSSWVPEVYLKASNGSLGHLFGYDVDVDGSRILVGAPEESSGGRSVSEIAETDRSASESGAAYLFTREPDGHWVQSLHFKAHNAEREDNFGRSVALTDTLVIVGARNEDGGGMGLEADPSDNSVRECGAAYIFRELPVLGWRQTLYLKSIAPEVDAEFGTALAFDGETLVVGSPFETVGGLTRVGAAYAYDFRRALSPEVCDGFDNDGNGDVDETFAECGSGCEAGLCQ